MSDENKDEKKVRDLQPDKDPKGGGFGTKPADSGDTTKAGGTTKGTEPNPLPPIPGIG